MKSVTTRPFRILADCGSIYQFMLEIYERDWRNSVPAPFFEYAYSSFASWMDITWSYKNCIWEDQGKIAAFCFYENPVTDIYFSLRPGYEELADEMIAYADAAMPLKGGSIRLILFEGQEALLKAAERQGYCKMGDHSDLQFDFKDALDYPLPEGFHFVSPKDYDPDKIGKCCWKGFDHEQDEGPWNHQAEQNNHILKIAPHATPGLAAVIADAVGEYACYAGMWWTPENKLAYMEPLCTIPEYRRKGLAAAALSELYRKTKALGATHMTGGSNEFYRKIGYSQTVKWTYWQKSQVCGTNMDNTY